MAMQALRPASKKYTLVGTGETSKQIATSGGIIVRGAIVTGQNTAAALRVIDSRNGSGEAGSGPGNYLLAANSGESVPHNIQHSMEQGLYIELEQGANTPSEATIFYD